MRNSPVVVGAPNAAAELNSLYLALGASRTSFSRSPRRFRFPFPKCFRFIDTTQHDLQQQQLLLLLHPTPTATTTTTTSTFETLWWHRCLMTCFSLERAGLRGHRRTVSRPHRDIKLMAHENTKSRRGSPTLS